jgi:hypothetical protein
MKTLRTLVSTVAALLLLAGVPLLAQYAPSAGSRLSRVATRFVASSYNYPVNSTYVVGAGTSATGTGTINVQVAQIALGDGRLIYPFNITSPIIVGGVGNQELVVPTSVSNCTTLSTPSGLGNCAITASFTYTHGPGESVISGTAGAAEAAYDAWLTGGGTVSVDNQWAAGVLTGCSACYASASAALSALTVWPTVGFEDDRTFPPAFWNVTPSTTTAFSAPSALTSASAFSSTTVAGSASYTGGTIHVCFAPVDIMGNEGPCSADYSFADTSAKAIQFTAPAAITGAVGWIPYIGLESGSSANEYQVPLVTQPTAIGALPASSGVCSLTTLETITPACAITNATYGQTGSGAVIAAYPVVTSPQAVGTGGLSTASYYIGNSNSHTTYAYVPGAAPGVSGIVKSSLPFHITTAAASTVPQILGTVALPPGFMNYVGRTIEVCGYAYASTQGASTLVKIQFEWDAQGSDVTTGLPVIIGGPWANGTLTTGTTGQFDFCQQFTTTVASASATGGTILAGHGNLVECALTTCATPFAGPNMTVAAVGSLNLAEAARLQVVMVQTTSTTAVPQLESLTVKVLN